MGAEMGTMAGATVEPVAEAVRRGREPAAETGAAAAVRQAPGGEWGLFWLRYAGALW